MSDPVYCLLLDGDAIVRQAVTSNVAQPGMATVGPDIFEAAKNRLNLCKWDGTSLSDYAPPAVPVSPPDCPSLPWWRTALKLWTRTDAASGAAVTRYSDVDAAIKALETALSADGSANVAVQRQGILAREQFEYANTVLLADLLKLAPAFGFTAADCAESLWRADRVRQGDLSGVWPLPAST